MNYKIVSGNGNTIHYASCERCEKVLEYVGSFAQKYCAECKKVVDRELSRERMRRYRENQKQKRNGDV